MQKEIESLIRANIPNIKTIVHQSHNGMYVISLTELDTSLEDWKPAVNILNDKFKLHLEHKTFTHNPTLYYILVRKPQVVKELI
jgi:hypothetical protein